MAEIETLFEQARLTVGLTADPTTSLPLPNDAASAYLNRAIRQIIDRCRLSENDGNNGAPGAVAALTFREAYQRYMSDPTHAWSRRTRIAHEATRSLALSIIGAELPLDQITRAHCRDFIEVLQRMPRSASKRFPALSPREAADQKRLSSSANDRMSIGNINAYLNKLGSFLNWATLEELIARNPARGMRLADSVRKRDKRRPFSAGQLRTIFDAPLYRGCVNDGNGYAKAGQQKPRGTRYWVPLLGLFTGMRLNEICQLECDDVQIVDGVACIRVSDSSRHGDTDKRLKTKASNRVIPVHHELLALGFMGFVADRVRARVTKLFADIAIDANGFRSTAMSKWFVRFCVQAGASEERTSFHSLRHNFRDAMREAQVPRDIAHALGGWASAAGGQDVADDYGGGYGLSTLDEAVQKIAYPALDLSHLKQARETDVVCSN